MGIWSVRHARGRARLHPQSRESDNVIPYQHLLPPLVVGYPGMALMRQACHTRESNRSRPTPRLSLKRRAQKNDVVAGRSATSSLSRISSRTGRGMTISIPIDQAPATVSALPYLPPVGTRDERSTPTPIVTISPVSPVSTHLHNVGLVRHSPHELDEFRVDGLEPLPARRMDRGGWIKGDEGSHRESSLN